MEKRLNQPYLPQMSDGVITQGDLDVQNAIFVLIRPYGHVSLNDYIVLHFGSLPVRTFLVEDPDAETVATFDIDADRVPDGDYLVWYEVTDAVGNPSGPSPAGWAVVNRNDDGTLEAPRFSDVNDNHEIDDTSVQTNRGTHVAVPAYDNITVGDRVSLLFYVTDDDSKLIENSQYTVSYRIQDNDVQSGFTVLVPAPYITVPDGKNCHAYYHRTPADGGADQVSLTADAILTLSNSTLLPAPTFIDAVHGWLTPDQVENGIRIQAAWPTIAAGNYVEMSLTGFTPDGTPVNGASAIKGRTVNESEAAQGNIVLTFDRIRAEAVELGRLNAGYTVAGQMSVIAGVGVDMTQHKPLNAPIFVQAEGGRIDENTIIQDGGAPVSVSWADMVAGDSVTLYLSGKTVDGNSVPGANVALTAIITDQNVTDKGVTLLLPLDNALAPGEGGTLLAQYTVDYYHSQGFAYSPSTEVTLMQNISSGLAFVLGTGAPIHDDTLTIRPHNNGKIYGPAGTSIDLSCNDPAVFTETGVNTMTVTLNQNGEATFAVRSAEPGEITVLAVSTGGGMQVNGSMSFSRYHTGTDTPQVHAWGQSSGSAADGNMACTIYLVTENLPALTKVHARVTQGNANLLESGSQDGDLLLNADKTVAIDLVDNTVEDVIVQVSLPESTGNVMNVPLHFVPAPVL